MKATNIVRITNSCLSGESLRFLMLLDSGHSAHHTRRGSKWEVEVYPHAVLQNAGMFLVLIISTLTIPLLLRHRPPKVSFTISLSYVPPLGTYGCT